VTRSAKVGFTFVIVIAVTALVVMLIAFLVLHPWGAGPSGRGADLAASLAGATHNTTGCTQQEGRDWWWCGTAYDWFDGFEGTFYRTSAGADNCWVAKPGRIRSAPRATQARGVRFVPGNGTVLRGCIGSGETGHVVDGPGQIPRLVGE
jgi:hypothetical protein